MSKYLHLCMAALEFSHDQSWNTFLHRKRHLGLGCGPAIFLSYLTYF